MTRTLISDVVAAAIALPSLGTAPAQANNEVVKRLLGGQATVIIRGATHDHLRARSRDGQSVTRHAPQPQHQPGRHARIVPAQCLRSTQTRQGRMKYFARPCLRHTMHNVDRLPAACAFGVRGEGRPITGYSPRCLRDHGWRRG